MDWLRTIARGRQRGAHRHTTQKWDREYRERRWERLGALSEVAHFAVLGGYFRAVAPVGGSFLDVGCGEGLLLPHVASHSERYLGIDVPAAVQLATERRGSSVPGVAFCAADINEFVPTELYDAIAFCESIYYVRDRATALPRYLRALTPKGILLVSCHARRKHDAIWGELDILCESLDAVQVRNANGVAWNVRVMRPRSVTQDSSGGSGDCVSASA